MLFLKSSVNVLVIKMVDMLLYNSFSWFFSTQPTTEKQHPPDFYFWAFQAFCLEFLKI